MKLAMSEMMDVELPGAKPVLDRGYLTLFFVYLNALCNRKEYLFAAEEMVVHPMVDTISAYIDAHISEPILVEELAEQVAVGGVVYVALCLVWWRLTGNRHILGVIRKTTKGGK